MLPEMLQALGVASTKGPVVVLLANEVTCQAIVIENPETVHQINLSEVSLQKLQALSDVMHSTIRRGATLSDGAP